MYWLSKWFADTFMVAKDAFTVLDETHQLSQLEPVIFVVNHTSLLDGPLVSVLFSMRRIRWFSAHTNVEQSFYDELLFFSPKWIRRLIGFVIRTFVRFGNPIMVNRDDPHSVVNKRAVREGCAAIKSGD